MVRRILPEGFKAKYKELMSSAEYDLFIDSLENGEPLKGLRVNTLKIPIPEFLMIQDFCLINNPYSADSFIIKGYESDNGNKSKSVSKDSNLSDDENSESNAAFKIGKTFLHQCGLIYSQEPSAAAAVSCTDIQNDFKVLDMCAAPGGKSTQIASQLGNKGLLVSNETVYKRAKILASNIERLGIKNCLVLCNTPEEIRDNYKKTFDVVLVDSPCSGEGMMRKEEQAITEWSQDNINMCSVRSQNILDCAAETVKDGGIIVYSTCTYAYEENEKVIYNFLINHNDYSLQEVKDGIKNVTENGKPEWLEKEIPLNDFYRNELLKIRRIFPHINTGEGHTVAVLKNNIEKTDFKAAQNKPEMYNRVYREMDSFQKKELDKLLKSMFINLPEGIFVLYENRIIMLPDTGLNVSRVNIIKYGIDVAVIEKNRIEPLHNLAVSSAFENIRNKVILGKNSSLADDYMRGKELNIDFDFTGWGIVCIDKYPLGLIKCGKDGIGKNHYPKGLRLL